MADRQSLQRKMIASSFLEHDQTANDMAIVHSKHLWTIQFASSHNSSVEPLIMQTQYHTIYLFNALSNIPTDPLPTLSFIISPSPLTPHRSALCL
jgi:hypothetical protein